MWGGRMVRRCGASAAVQKLNIKKQGRLPMEEVLGEAIRSGVGGTVVSGNIRSGKGQHVLLLRRERCR